MSEWQVTVTREIEHAMITKEGKVVFGSSDGPVFEAQLSPEDLQAVKQILQPYLN